MKDFKLVATVSGEIPLMFVAGDDDPAAYRSVRERIGLNRNIQITYSIGGRTFKGTVKVEDLHLEYLTV